MNKIGTLRLYRELGMEDPEQAYKEFLEEQLMPQQAIDDANKTIESKEAQEDLQLVIAGKQPVERDDISEDYINYLNDYLLTQQYEQLPAGCPRPGLGTSWPVSSPKPNVSY
jgi:hypothetical protein